MNRCKFDTLVRHNIWLAKLIASASGIQWGQHRHSSRIYSSSLLSLYFCVQKLVLASLRPELWPGCGLNPAVKRSSSNSKHGCSAQSIWISLQPWPLNDPGVIPHSGKSLLLNRSGLWGHCYGLVDARILDCRTDIPTPYVLDFLGGRRPTLSVLVLTLCRFLLTE